MKKRPKNANAKELLEHILSRCAEGPGGCLEWGGGKIPKGYGTIYFQGKTMLVHRVIMEAIHPGFLSSKLHTLHLCDNPRCCNPAHIIPGTKHDNMQDMCRKGRNKNTIDAAIGNTQTQGSKNGRAKLTEDKVIRIRKQIASGQSLHSLAEEYGVAYQTISDVRARRRWGHI